MKIALISSIKLRYDERILIIRQFIYQFIAIEMIAIESQFAIK